MLPPITLPEHQHHEQTLTQLFASNGVVVGVRANDASVLRRLRECLPPDVTHVASEGAVSWFSLLRVPRDSRGRVRFELRAGGRLLHRGYRLSPLVPELDSAIRLEVGLRAADRLFVHAGVVGWRGNAIVLPGASGTGKTSLVSALLRAGATYYSDEYALLDETGAVYPYARPLSVRQGSVRRLLRRPEADLGAQVGVAPLPVKFIVHTTHHAGGRWEPRLLPPGRSALAMFSHTLAARERSSFALSVLSRAAHGAISWEGERGDAAATAAALLDYTDALNSSTPSVPSLRSLT
ncbi:MAG: hypothetical protein JWO05_3326 [Gemmatimonadetes bacterium]|nr:hypothetical protein [Gemmatimonadota bacterium]